MIGYLRGSIRQKQASYVLLDVNGVGYEVNVPATVVQELADVDGQAELHIHTHVREDAHTLFGFTGQADRDLFRVLINVSKIGPRTALGILSEMKVSELVVCVQLEDPRSLEKVPGIGKKTATRLLLELRDKVGQFPVDNFDVRDSSTGASNIVLEATEALIELGYSHRESRRAVLSIRDNADSTEQAVVLALASLNTVSP